jgi:hypothetical protein
LQRSGHAERLLRGGIDTVPPVHVLLAIGACGSALLGLALGASSGNAWMAVYAAIKVPLLLIATSILCVPSFYVLNAVLGLRDDFAAAMRGLLAAQATLGLALGALAPLLVFCSLSIFNPYLLTLLDAVLFAAATWGAQQVLARHYQPLVQRNPRHRIALTTWLVLYAFAGMQAAWVLRPFRGTEGFAVQFLRTEALEQNAYLVLIDHVLRLFR